MLFLVFLFLTYWVSYCQILKDVVEEVSHVGFVVKNVDQYIFLYRDIFGFEVKFDRIEDNPMISEELGLNTTTPKLRNVMIQTVNPLFTIQFFQYINPIGERIPRKVNDIGLNHLGIGVKNIWKVYDTLKSIDGLSFVSNGPVEVGKWLILYMNDFDNNFIEFYQLKN